MDGAAHGGSKRVSIMGRTVHLHCGLSGVVKFFGKTKFGAGDWVGVELPGPDGINDGSVNGVHYFAAAPRHGMFVQPSQVKSMASPTKVSRASVVAAMEQIVQGHSGGGDGGAAAGVPAAESESPQQAHSSPPLKLAARRSLRAGAPRASAGWPGAARGDSGWGAQEQRAGEEERAVALYDYSSSFPHELPLRRGDVVRVLERGVGPRGQQWWRGERVVPLPGARNAGYFPASYVGDWSGGRQATGSARGSGSSLSRMAAPAPAPYPTPAPALATTPAHAPLSGLEGAVAAWGGALGRGKPTAAPLPAMRIDAGAAGAVVPLHEEVQLRSGRRLSAAQLVAGGGGKRAEAPPLSPAERTDAALAAHARMAGWLYKKGGGSSLFGRRNWKKRFFRIERVRAGGDGNDSHAPGEDFGDGGAAGVDSSGGDSPGGVADEGGSVGSGGAGAGAGGQAPPPARCKCSYELRYYSAKQAGESWRFVRKGALRLSGCRVARVSSMKHKGVFCFNVCAGAGPRAKLCTITIDISPGGAKSGALDVYEGDEPAQLAYNFVRALNDPDAERQCDMQQLEKRIEADIAAAMAAKQPQKGSGDSDSDSDGARGRGDSDSDSDGGRNRGSGSDDEREDGDGEGKGEGKNGKGKGKDKDKRKSKSKRKSKKQDESDPDKEEKTEVAEEGEPVAAGPVAEEAVEERALVLFAATSLERDQWCCSLRLAIAGLPGLPLAPTIPELEDEGAHGASGAQEQDRQDGDDAASGSGAEQDKGEDKSKGKDTGKDTDKGKGKGKSKGKGKGRGKDKGKGKDTGKGKDVETEKEKEKGKVTGKDKGKSKDKGKGKGKDKGEGKSKSKGKGKDKVREKECSKNKKDAKSKDKGESESTGSQLAHVKLLSPQLGQHIKVLQVRADGAASFHTLVTDVWRKLGARFFGTADLDVPARAGCTVAMAWEDADGDILDVDDDASLNNAVASSLAQQQQLRLTATFRSRTGGLLQARPGGAMHPSTSGHLRSLQ
eukprot:g611.t1